jgi:hypothetical protein
MSLLNVIAGRRRSSGSGPQYPAPAAINYAVAAILGDSQPQDIDAPAAMNYAITSQLGDSYAHDIDGEAAMNYAITGSLV